MIEKFAAGGIDAIGTAAEIDLVEIQFEDLVLGEFALQRHRQHGLTHFAAHGIFVVEKNGPRELLRNGGRALQAAVGIAVLPGKQGRTGHALGVQPEMRSEAAILDGDHRVFHHRRDLVARQPAAIARPDFLNDGAVRRTHADHLALLDILEIGVARQFGPGDRHHHHQGDQADQAQSDPDLDHARQDTQDRTLPLIR